MVAFHSDCALHTPQIRENKHFCPLEVYLSILNQLLEVFTSNTSLSDTVQVKNSVVTLSREDALQTHLVFQESEEQRQTQSIEQRHWSWLCKYSASGRKHGRVKERWASFVESIESLEYIYIFCILDSFFLVILYTSIKRYQSLIFGPAEEKSNSWYSPSFFHTLSHSLSTQV